MEATLSCRCPWYWPTSPVTCATAPRSMPAMRALILRPERRRGELAVAVAEGEQW